MRIDKIQERRYLPPPSLKSTYFAPVSITGSFLNGSRSRIFLHPHWLGAFGRDPLVSAQLWPSVPVWLVPAGSPAVAVSVQGRL